MVMLIGIEGALGDARNPQTGYTGSFVHRIVTSWPGPSEYFAGPDVSAKDVTTVATNADAYLQANYTAQNKGLCILGYSLGGCASVVLAELLEARNVNVDCLALLDGITPDNSIGTAVPANVAMTFHAKCGWLTGSRLYWPNCAQSAVGSNSSANFHVSHWGASGVPNFGGQAALPPGTTMASYVTEFDYITKQTHPINVTWQQDIQNAMHMYHYVRAPLLAAYAIGQARQPAAPAQPGINPPASPSGKPTQTHTVATGETLSLISQQHWNDILLFPLIYDANRAAVGDDWHLIRPGIVLTIPDKASFSAGQLISARKRAVGG